MVTNAIPGGVQINLRSREGVVDIIPPAGVRLHHLRPHGFGSSHRRIAPAGNTIRTGDYSQHPPLSLEDYDALQQVTY